MPRPSKYSPELRERAVRMVFDHAHEYPSQWATIRSVADKLGCTTEALRRWVRPAERDHGERPGLTTDERAQLKQLQRDNFELKLQEGGGVFRPGGARPPSEVMVSFIDQHRDTFGVEPICAVLPIAPSTYFLRKLQQQDVTQQSARARRDDELQREIQRVWDEHEQVYGPQKVWKQLLGAPPGK